jgi:hypothetical protein
LAPAKSLTSKLNVLFGLSFSAIIFQQGIFIFEYIADFTNTKLCYFFDIFEGEKNNYTLHNVINE